MLSEAEKEELLEQVRELYEGQHAYLRGDRDGYHITVGTTVHVYPTAEQCLTADLAGGAK